jgi:hypothetical protein
VVRRIAATLALCFIATPALAQERWVIHDTEKNEFTFRWAPSTGPVYGYEVCVDYGSYERQCYGTIETEYTFIPYDWVTWFIEVRGMDILDDYGDWSPRSTLFNINPSPADINFDGGVGGADFDGLINEWGEVAWEVLE